MTGITIYPDAATIATTGIIANQKKMSVTSNNLANSENKDYSERNVQISANSVNGVTIGVQANAETRITDPLRVKDLREKTSELSRLSIIEQFQSEIQNQMGTTRDKNSLGTQLNKIKNSLQGLADAPELPGKRNEVVELMRSTTRSINDLAAFYQEQRQRSEDGIDGIIQGINSILNQIHNNNKNISIASGIGESTATNLDNQEKLLKDLAGFMNFKVLIRNDQTVYLYTANGEPLVTTLGASTLEFTPTPGITPIDTPATLGRITINGNDITDQISDGQIGGFLYTRDTLLPNLQEELDEFTLKFRDTMNVIHNRGMSVPGRQSMVGEHTFATLGAATVADFNGSIRVALVVNATNDVVGGTFVPYDIDLTALGGNTIGDIRAAIDAIPGITATLDPVTFQLTIAADNAAHTVAITSLGGAPVVETTSGLEFSHHFGLNNLFTTAERFIGDGNLEGRNGLAQKIAVRDDILQDRNFLSRGRLYAGADTIPQEKAFRPGDATIINDLITGLESDVAFANAGKLPSRQESFVNFSNTIWHNAAIDCSNSKNDLETQQQIFDQTEKELLARVGVNAQQQVVTLLETISIIQALTRVVAANNKVVDAIMSIAA